MRLGNLEVFAVQDSRFWLDGGAMFGVVPKPLWRRLTKPDRKNRIYLGANCFVVLYKDAALVVDTGWGDEWGEKERRIYRLEGGGLLRKRLADAGVAEDDVRFVANTHLHIDHAGGNCTNGAPAFRKARYLLQTAEVDAAQNPSPLSAGSYREGDWRPLIDAGVLELLPSDAEPLPHCRLIKTGGHTKGHQVLLVETPDVTVLFPGDLIPTRHHLNLPYIMGYDLYPEELVERKRQFLEQAVKDGWLLLFEHDVEPCFCRVGKRGRRFYAKEVAEATR